MFHNKSLGLVLAISCVLILGSAWHQFSWAQGQKKILQLTGLVVGGNKSVGVPAVNITIPAAGRGTYSNLYGYFSIPTLAGDSVVISALGYKRQYYLVPKDGRSSISVIIHLEDDTLELPTVEVFPYATEELFKQAFLDLKLPEAEYASMRRNLSDERLSEIRLNMPGDGSLNSKWFLNKQLEFQQEKYYNPTARLFSPFAWARFIESVKRGDLKRKRKSDD